MERLTKRIGTFVYYTKGKYEDTIPAECETQDVRNILSCLAAYEDTGLEPKEIERIVDAYGRGLSLRTESAQRLEMIREIPDDRLWEIAEAERKGRHAVFLPGEDVVPVAHTVPVLRYRTQRYERYEESGLNDNGEMLYVKRVFVDEKSYVMYCPSCGKRLCSRFTNFCPSCGVKMSGGTV